MELSKLTYSKGTRDDFLKELVVHQDSFFDLQFGTAHLKKGMRTPIEGDYTRHDQVKIVCILKGKVQLTLEQESKKDLILTPGDIFKVERYEGHSGYILEDTELIYVMFGKKEQALDS